MAKPQFIGSAMKLHDLIIVEMRSPVRVIYFTATVTKIIRSVYDVQYEITYTMDGSTEVVRDDDIYGHATESIDTPFNRQQANSIRSKQ